MVIRIKYSPNLLIPEKDLNAANEKLTTYFNKKWLESNNKHPLQILWRRTDLLAKAELFCIGKNIETIENSNPDWVKQKVRKIKSNDMGTAYGAIFEILAAGMFERGKNHEVILPPPDNPGFDLIAKFKDNARMNVSCKNHLKSRYSKEFDDESAKFKERFVNLCKSLKVNVQCVISSNIYPSKYREWKILETSIIDFMLTAVNNGLSAEYQCFKAENWTVYISNLSDYEKKCSKINISYNLIIMAQFHQNELRNLRGHLNDGLDNLSTHGPIQNNDNINIIFVNLGDNYSLDFCEKIGNEYLEENKNKPIAGLYFQKGYPTSDSEKYDIMYSYRLVKNDFYDLWCSNKKERKVNLSSPIASKYGLTDFKRSFLTEKNGKKGNTPLIPNNYYFYHKGELYLKYSEKLFTKAATPGMQINLVKETKKGPEIHYIASPPYDNFSLI